MSFLDQGVNGAVFPFPQIHDSSRQISLIAATVEGGAFQGKGDAVVDNGLFEE